jgi:hypothetical protein
LGGDAEPVVVSLLMPLVLLHMIVLYDFPITQPGSVVP